VKNTTIAIDLAKSTASAVLCASLRPALQDR